ncbi:MAG: hypothetical protein L3J56_12405, partial [Bacteroidales bacterium]|nr:hypothetical protein [Bacteroidales bacterium]
NGDFIVGGTSNSSDGDVSNPGGNFDMWLLKIDNTGNIIWEKNIGGTDADFLSGIQKYSSCDCYLISGYSNSDDRDFPVNYGNYDAWVLAIDENGNIDYNRISYFSTADWAFLLSYAKKSLIPGLS